MHTTQTYHCASAWASIQAEWHNMDRGGKGEAQCKWVFSKDKEPGLQWHYPPFPGCQ